jgi:hypothetical protein
MRKVVMLALLFLTAHVAAGCAAGPSEERPEPGASSRSSVSEQQGFSVTLKVQPATTGQEGSFSLTLEVRNVSGEPRDFVLPSAQVFEFVAFEAKGPEVWRWSEGMVFAQALQPLSLEPGEGRVFKAALPAAGLSPGRYLIQGYFTGLPETRPGVEVEVSGP